MADVTIVQEAHGVGTDTGTMTLDFAPTVGNTILWLLSSDSRSSAISFPSTTHGWYSSSSGHLSAVNSIGLEASGWCATGVVDNGSGTTLTYNMPGVANKSCWSIYELACDGGTVRADSGSVQSGGGGACSIDTPGSRTRARLHSGGSTRPRARIQHVFGLVDDYQAASSSYDPVVFESIYPTTWPEPTVTTSESHTGGTTRWNGRHLYMAAADVTEPDDVWVMPELSYLGSNSTHGGGIGLVMVVDSDEMLELPHSRGDSFIGNNLVQSKGNTGSGTAPSATFDAETTEGYRLHASVALYDSDGFSATPTVTPPDGWVSTGSLVETGRATGEDYAVFTFLAVDAAAQTEVAFTSSVDCDWSVIVREIVSGDAYDSEGTGAFTRSVIHESRISSATSTTASTNDIGRGHNIILPLIHEDDVPPFRGIGASDPLWYITHTAAVLDDADNTDATGWGMTGVGEDYLLRSFGGPSGLSATHFDIWGRVEDTENTDTGNPYGFTGPSTQTRREHNVSVVVDVLIPAYSTVFIPPVVVQDESLPRLQGRPIFITELPYTLRGDLRG
jgi:hypothetical protein